MIFLFLPQIFWDMIQFDEHILPVAGSTTVLVRKLLPKRVLPTYHNQLRACLTCPFALVFTQGSLELKTATGWTVDGFLG